MNLLADIEEFHKKYGLEYNGAPRMLPADLSMFRRGFMLEELNEYEDNCRRPGNQNDIPLALEGQLDALVDLVYVALGTAYLQGFDFNEAWRRVHAANMTKIRTLRSEDSIRGSVYDVIKPPNFVAPRHLDLVSDHAHKEEVE